jgi:hypothetical protein
MSLQINLTMTGQFGEHDQVSHQAGAQELTLTRPVLFLPGTATTTPAALDYAGVTAPQLITITNTHATVGLKVRVAPTETPLTVPPGHTQPLYAPGDDVEVEAVSGSVSFVYSIAK